MKNIIYYGDTQKIIAMFSTKAKQRIAQLLTMLATDLKLQPHDFKSIPTIGMGSYELRVKIEKQYRVFYVAKFNEAIYVLHAFVKKTQTTAKQDIEKGRARYKALVRYQQGIKS